MFVLEVNRLGEVSFEEWEDPDYEEELAPRRTMLAVPEELAFQLSLWLAQGDIERVRSEPWEAAT